MRRTSKFNIGLGLLICLAAGLIFTASRAEDVAQSDYCPADMVYIEKAKICVDRYEYPNKQGAIPFHGLDAEEAVEVCRKGGKRLLTQEEFKIACGGDGNEAYPYGGAFIPNGCRTGLGWSDGIAPSGSYPTCVRNGVYDLTGNVWEWVRPSRGGAVLAGGAWNTAPERSSCESFSFVQRVVVSQNVGVRCATEAKRTSTGK